MKNSHFQKFKNYTLFNECLYKSPNSHIGRFTRKSTNEANI